MDGSKHLSGSPEVIWGDDMIVTCAGEGLGDFGHPKVFYNLGEEGRVVCSYCRREFRLKKFHSTSSQALENRDR